MGLPIPLKTVEISGGGTFAVRGFSFDDALAVYYRHSGELAALFDHFAAKGSVEQSDVTSIGATMLAKMPLVLAEIIATAVESDESYDDRVTWARRISAGSQLDALQKIGELTFTSDMPPGKFLAVAMQMARSATATMNAGRTA